MRKLGIVGAGNMGEALIRGLLKSRTFRPRDLAATERRADRRRAMARRYGIRFFRTNGEMAGSSSAVLLAVKPQDIDSAVEEMAPHLDRRKLVISIAAGVPTRRIEKNLHRGVPVVRVMPNTACLVGQGISAIARGRFATEAHRKTAAKILSAVGKVLYLDESKLNAVTAVSGSGPAYFFYFIEALTGAAQRLGLSPEVSKALVHQTALGAALLLIETGEAPEVLRAKVTSKGGTTEAAIRVLEEKYFKGLVFEALQRASRRAFELSKS